MTRTSLCPCGARVRPRAPFLTDVHTIPQRRTRCQTLASILLPTSDSTRETCRLIARGMPVTCQKVGSDMPVACQTTIWQAARQSNGRCERAFGQRGSANGRSEPAVRTVVLVSRCERVCETGSGCERKCGSSSAVICSSLANVNARSACADSG
jgi:hypothetical protein